MAGVWKISGARIVETNDPTAIPPVNGTLVAFAPNLIQFVGASRVMREDVERDLGFPLDWYFNMANGRTFLFGYGWNHLQTGGLKFQILVAGGSMDHSTMLVEAYTSLREPLAQELYARAHYALLRVSPAAVGEGRRSDIATRLGN